MMKTAQKSNNPIIASIQRRQELAIERAKLAAEAAKLRYEQKAVNQAFIREQLEKFVADMQRSTHSYIIWGGGHPFTKFVNRDGLRLNKEHGQAIFAFNQAKKALARVFVESVLNNENGEREKIVDYCGIKNIADMQKYFGD